MKNLLLTLVIFSVILLTGCQENSVTDPLSIESSNKMKNNPVTSNQGSIPLQGTLEVLGIPNLFYTIDGSIDYIHELMFVDPIPPAQQYYVKLKLSTKAVLLGENDFPGNKSNTISLESEDVFYIPPEGKYLLEKTYFLKGNFDDMVLILKFLVTTDSVELNSVHLAFIVIPNKTFAQDTSIYPPCIFPPIMVQ